MASSAENPQPIVLPELVQTEFELAAADLFVQTGEQGLAHPQLVLEGEEDAFTHSYKDGVLHVKENMQNGSIFEFGTRGSRFYASIPSSVNRIRIVGGSVSINGVEITGDGVSVGSAAPRRASLLLPAGISVSHDIDTMSGDIELAALSARVVYVASKSGSILVRNTEAGDINLKTMSGAIDLEAVRSSAPVRAESMSGSIAVGQSVAPSWRLKTMSGNVTARSTEGRVDASTMSGRTRVY